MNGFSTEKHRCRCVCTYIYIYTIVYICKYIYIYIYIFVRVTLYVYTSSSKPRLCYLDGPLDSMFAIYPGPGSPGSPPGGNDFEGNTFHLGPDNGLIRRHHHSADHWVLSPEPCELDD